MQGNLLISGLDEATDEAVSTTAEMVTDLFSQTMKVSRKIQIQSAVRIGKATPRTVLVKLQDSTDKGDIFKAAKNLKTVRNSHDGEIYVNSQLPAKLQEQKRWYRYLMKYNHSLTGTGKRTLSIKRGELYVDGAQYRPAVMPPSSAEVMFPLDPQHVDKVRLTRGEDFRKGNCKFVAYSMYAQTVADVRAAYTKVSRLNSAALHIAVGYRLAGADYISCRGCADDGEYGAGRTIYKVLEDANEFNQAIFVVRFYGNKHLGPIRFQLIADAARSAMRKFKNKYEKLVVALPKEQDEEIVFKKPTSITGYLRAASPRPYSKGDWGSTESVGAAGATNWDTAASQESDIDSPHPRSRANSMDSNTSYGSIASIAK